MLVVFLPTFVADAKFIYGHNFVAPSTFARIFIMVKQYEFQGSRLESISIYVLQFYLKRRQKLHKKVNYLSKLFSNPRFDDFETFLKYSNELKLLFRQSFLILREKSPLNIYMKSMSLELFLQFSYILSLLLL